ncbi:FeoA family protein [Myxosarcina sp. GI1]|uniref:FeoA family protein n=1 Tax=Myxosarcina sp. GI1 TaxID=1541065 RepID=UPI00056A906E|nr:FeoA family protein [Myxosarcina sp. GI1]
MTLLELKSGNLAVVKIIELKSHKKELGSRLAAMGIIPDKQIKILRKAWFGGPLHIRVGSTTEIAIRRREAEMVRVRCLDSLQ